MSTQDTTLPPLEQERATFEAWKRTQTDGWTDFEVWQARAALAAQAPQPEPCGFMSRATYSTSSGAGYKQITFRFSELIAANQIRLWAMSYGAKAANHEVPKWAPQQAQGVAADADLASVAYQGYDSYWTENCLGDESEAWASSAKAVLAFCAAAPQAAPAPAPQALTPLTTDQLDRLETIAFAATNNPTPMERYWFRKGVIVGRDINAARAASAGGEG